MSRSWKDGETVANFLYYDESGRIIGEVGLAGHQIKTKHTTTIYPNNKEVFSLGMYIGTDHAKAAVEKWWHIQDRTLIEHGNQD
jgi:rRNA processing protein Krr1/Pno1